ncbi:MAG: SGNH/GDSL hydrolase family protein [Verrucomicrobia bacterium]|nr:SGNH/GDSL hydrolase family protein [Verrucomicrobiota bacterium]
MPEIPAIDKRDATFAVPDAVSGLNWFDIRSLSLEGQAFSDTLGPFHRLPARAQGVVPDAVWSLSPHAAGLSVRFVTDAPSISMRWTLGSDALAMPHMPATAVSGFDLYMRKGEAWKFLGVASPRTFPQNQEILLQSMIPAERACTLYLPLFNELREAWIGIPTGCMIAKALPRPPGLRKPVVFYGTSIVQGGCASRPGMAHVNILGRRLDRPIVNLGFAGNGRAEQSLAILLGEINAAAYVIDTLPNMNGDLARERIVPFVRTLWQARPSVPIILVDHFIYSREEEVGWMKDFQRDLVVVLDDAIRQLESEGVRTLHRVGATHLLDGDSECTVDGTHPTDTGFVHLADALEPTIRRALGMPT